MKLVCVCNAEHHLYRYLSVHVLSLLCLRTSSVVGYCTYPVMSVRECTYTVVQYIPLIIIRRQGKFCYTLRVQLMMIASYTLSRGEYRTTVKKTLAVQSMP